jgi:hypothetical protein
LHLKENPDFKKRKKEKEKVMASEIYQRLLRFTMVSSKPILAPSSPIWYGGGPSRPQ